MIATDLLRFPVALLQMALGTALFTGHGHRMLPDGTIRLTSPGVVTMGLLVVAASCWRHTTVHDADLFTILSSLAIHCGILVWAFGGSRPHVVALALCASAGVDILVAAAFSLGLFSAPVGGLKWVFMGWEILAIVVAVAGRLAAADARSKA